MILQSPSSAPSPTPGPYAPSQISAYLTHIGLPIRQAPTPPYLSALQRHHLAAIPFENLALHYSPSRIVSLDPQDVFTKLIVRKRGGYCLEQNPFFAHVLRALGFRVWTAGARVRPRGPDGLPRGEYVGFSHVVNVVVMGDGDRWMVDVGFGGDGPTCPMRLVSGEQRRNIGTQEMRLDWEGIKGGYSEDQKVWVYSVRNFEGGEWRACYCFLEAEFLQQDLAVMAFFVNESPLSWFTTMTVAVRMLLDEEGEKFKGKIMLVGADVKENCGGRTSLAMTCGTERVRVEALKMVFGLVLTEEECRGIKGRVTALPAGDESKNEQWAAKHLGMMSSG